MPSLPCERRNGIAFHVGAAAIAPLCAIARRAAAFRTFCRVKSLKETLQACLRSARDSVLGLGLTSNRSSVVSDRLAESTRFQNVRKRLRAGFTTQRDHLLYPHTGSLQYERLSHISIPDVRFGYSLQI